MVTRETILKQLPSYQGKRVLLVQDQDTKDIIKYILETHKQYPDDYDKISKFFWRGNLKDTSKYIFDFLKHNVKYCIEPDSHQSVKSPAAIVSSGIFENGNNDCKHYALFSAGILDSLKRFGYPVDWLFRFANYRSFTKDPGHVFTVALDGHKEYWIDPVLETFNNRHNYISKIDKKVSSMALYKINGVPANYGEAIGRRRLFAKIALAPSRNAYLALVGLNVKKMATHLYEVLKNPQRMEQLKQKWEKKGGNFTKLRNTILKGSKHRGEITKNSRVRLRKRRGVNGIDGGYEIAGIYEPGQQIGDDSVGIAIVAILAAAVPVLTALKEFLPKHSAVADAAETAIKDIEKAGGLNMPGVQIPNERGELPQPIKNDIPITDNQGTVQQGGDMKQYLPYVLIGGLGLILLTRKSN